MHKNNYFFTNATFSDQILEVQECRAMVIAQSEGDQLMRLIVMITEQSKRIVAAGAALDRLSSLIFK